ncbi:metal ABC transporter substrate-binding protein [Aquihabitans sp. McL0605]|uniref:metal ABC transporter substrate-binding protein n=1 Tax=Aquihabitans sp. McL0605 TaxID=3415671 RepID=UPI003CF12B0A
MPAEPSSHRPPAPAPRGAARLAALAAAVLLAGSVLAGCGSSGDGAAPGQLRVVASFYPLQWMAEQVGGDHVHVTSLTKPGAEPHDLELSPRDVGAVQDADVIAYLSGFQPSVDTAVADAGSGTIFDAKEAADLDLTFNPIEDGQRSETGTTDPHFWLDPIRMSKVTGAFAAAMAGADPVHAADYRTNAKVLDARLADLDHDLETGLADCASKDLVTSHNAFGYLARRYGLEQVPVTGLTPEEEPSPSDLATVSDFVAAHDVKTIYFETLISPDIAKTVARETGARTDVLDPIEGLNDRSQGSDYLEVMQANLRNLRKGQPCR